jgi:hypothetical protein
LLGRGDKAGEPCAGSIPAASIIIIIGPAGLRECETWPGSGAFSVPESVIAI